MDVLHDACAGLDVHKKTVVVCVLRSSPGGIPDRQVRTFGTMTAELEQLRDWLIECGCRHVAMEATGAYWKPVYNVLEERGDLHLQVFNSQHLKTVPGRKTDVKDAEWIATLLRHGFTCYYLLTRGGTYQDLGETYFDERDRQVVVRRSVRRLQSLGYAVHLEEIQAA
jgi:transposase